MNIQKIFEAVKAEPKQSTLIVAVSELENQGYKVSVNEKYNGSASLIEAEANGELNGMPMNNGIVLSIHRNNEQQSFRVQFLDIDAICFTSINTPPVIYNPDYTTGFYKSGQVA